MKKKAAEKLKKSSGQAMVEFALVLPLLLTILMGILDFGWIFMNRYQVEKAASSAARYGTINVNRYKESSQKQSYLDGIRDKAQANLPSGALLQVVDGSAGGGATALTAVVAVSVSRTNVSVTVRYPIRTLTFVAGSIFGKYYTATATCVLACA